MNQALASGVVLPGQDSTIGTRLCAATQYAGSAVAQDDLSATEADRVGCLDDMVAAACQCLGKMVGEVRFDFDSSAFSPLPTWRIKRSLRVKVIVKHGGDGLDMSLGLHEATHDTEGAYGFTITSDEPWDDGVISAFAGGQRIGVLGVKGER